MFLEVKFSAINFIMGTNQNGIHIVGKFLVLIYVIVLLKCKNHGNFLFIRIRRFQIVGFTKKKLKLS